MILTFRCGHTGFGTVDISILIGCGQHILIEACIPLTGYRRSRWRQGKNVNVSVLDIIILLVLAGLFSVPLSMVARCRFSRSLWGRA